MAIQSRLTWVTSTMAASISGEEQVFMMTLGQRISALRKHAGLTQA
ncbi:transcriptional regulator, partial [Xenorhabdus sp. Vera]|nr:transcriptional regulator [Xenorhabdus sp. Vera]